MQLSQQLEDWCRAWSAQCDPAQRRMLLENAHAENCPWADEMEQLWQRRFGKNGKTVPDGYFVWWMDARFAGTRSDGLLGVGKRKLKKVYAAGMEQLGLSWAAVRGTQARRLLDADLEQMAEQYIRICLKDKQYSSVAFGLMTMQEEATVHRIAQDLAAVCAVYPARVGMDAEYAPLRRAAVIAFGRVLPGAQMPAELMREEQM